MDVDIAATVAAVRRQVADREHLGRPARVLVATRTYRAAISEVWDALTNPERIPRWFLPVSGDLRLGGRYELEGTAEGEITGCEPPRHVAVTWEYGGDVSWVDVRLAEYPGGGTSLRLEHVAHVGDDRWDEFGPGAVGVGWDLAMVGLEEHLATGATVDPDGWTSSAEGKELMRRSSDDWCRASVAAGTPEEAARLAAERTTAAYTGSGETPAEP